jgi:hypothetical protein
MYNGTYIPLTDCVDRRLYRIQSRNLTVGVYRADVRGFVGIRTKFGSRYLFTEYHWDTGEPFGTVKPVEDAGESVPDGMRTEDDLGTACSACGRPAAFDHEAMKAGMKGWNHADKSPRCEGMGGQAVPNDALFAWIEERSK